MRNGWLWAIAAATVATIGLMAWFDTGPQAPPDPRPARSERARQNTWGDVCSHLGDRICGVQEALCLDKSTMRVGEPEAWLERCEAEAKQRCCGDGSRCARASGLNDRDAFMAGNRCAVATRESNPCAEGWTPPAPCTIPR